MLTVSPTFNPPGFIHDTLIILNTMFFYSFADFQDSSSLIIPAIDLSHDDDDESHEIFLSQESQCEGEDSHLSDLAEDSESTPLSYLEILN